jgi:CRP/FNR family transcriptional regulator, anaerobic regulatory protein
MEKIKATYLQTVLKFCPKLTEVEQQYLLNGLTVIEFPAKHFYIHAGEIQRHIGFVYQGLLRAFYIDNEGSEITVRFARENGYATDYGAFVSQERSKYYVQCLEPCTIVNLAFTHIQDGYAHYSGLERFGRLIAEQVLKAQQKRIEGFLFDNAEQRYLHFIQESPDLFNRVSLSYLSSYLGIERPSLSRIRKKLSKK